MRILHLIDLHERSDEAVMACRAAVSLAPGRHRVLAVGSSGEVAAARAAGLPVDASAPMVGPVPELSYRRMRRLLADRDGRDATRPWADIVQCWSAPMLGLARLSSGQRTPPRVGGLLRPPAHELRGLGLRRFQYGLHDATLFAPDRFTRAAWAEAASARRGGRLLEQNIRLLDPTLAPTSHPDLPERDALRESLGLEPEDVVIGLLADPPGAVDLYRFSFTLGLLFTTGVPVVGLVRRGAGHERRSTRYVRLHGRRWGLRITDRSTEAMLAACDLAVWDVGDTERGGIVGAGCMSIGAAARAGVPVVAARHPLALEALGAKCPELVARDATMGAIAERLLWLYHHPEPRRELVRRLVEPHAREHAFAPELRRLWEEVVNLPMPRPGLPMPTALARRLEGAA
jgi:hypothetical protein